METGVLGLSALMPVIPCILVRRAVGCIPVGELVVQTKASSPCLL